MHIGIIETVASNFACINAKSYKIIFISLEIFDYIIRLAENLSAGEKNVQFLNVGDRIQILVQFLNVGDRIKILVQFLNVGDRI